MTRTRLILPILALVVLVSGCLLSVGCDAPGMKKEFTNSIGMKMVLIPAGEFQMGSKLSAREVAANYHRSETWFDEEHPRHTVKITRPFYLGATEVTQAQYRKVMWENPSHSEAANCPVGNVSWHEVQEFCRRLSAKEARTYRSPTEAQWEYACRAGATTEHCFGDDVPELADHAWYAKNSDGKMHPVGQKKPNAWGLYDMHGNVWELCRDWYDKDYYGSSPERDPTGPGHGKDRVSRGGSWYNGAYACRAAHRGCRPPSIRSYLTGFRVLCVAAGEIGMDSDRCRTRRAGARRRMCPLLDRGGCRD